MIELWLLNKDYMYETWLFVRMTLSNYNYSSHKIWQERHVTTLIRYCKKYHLTIPEKDLFLTLWLPLWNNISMEIRSTFHKHLKAWLLLGLGVGVVTGINFVELLVSMLMFVYIEKELQFAFLKVVHKIFLLLQQII